MAKHDQFGHLANKKAILLLVARTALKSMSSNLMLKRHLTCAYKDSRGGPETSQQHPIRTTIRF